MKKYLLVDNENRIYWNIQGEDLFDAFKRGLDKNPENFGQSPEAYDRESCQGEPVEAMTTPDGGWVFKEGSFERYVKYVYHYVKDLTCMIFDITDPENVELINP